MRIINIGLIFALTLAVLISLPSRKAQANSRYASIIIEQQTGQVLRSRRADRELYPASLTKMMTLYMVFEALDSGRLSLNQQLRVSRNASNQPPSRLGLSRGDTISVENAILALVVKSANDVAVVVAESLADDEAAFARLMTAQAHELGMSSTTFRNASGLPNRRQTSTARDISRLARALYTNYPHHYHFFSHTSFTYNGQTIRGHNRVLARYEGADGLKTGYISASGFNLATSAERDGHRIIAVVLGGRTAQSRDAHMTELLDLGFERVVERYGRRQDLIRPLRREGRRPNILMVETPSSINNTHPTPPITHSIMPIPPRRPSMDTAITEAETEASRARAILATALEEGENLEVAALLYAASEGNTPWQAQGDTDEEASTEFINAMLANIEAGHWAVQVGAFTNERASRWAIGEAQRYAPEHLTTARAVIILVENRPDNSPLYRARLQGLEEAEARTACTTLTNLGKDCMIIAP